MPCRQVWQGRMELVGGRGRLGQGQYFIHFQPDFYQIAIIGAHRHCLLVHWDSASSDDSLLKKNNCVFSVTKSDFFFKPGEHLIVTPWIRGAMWITFTRQISGSPDFNLTRDRGFPGHLTICMNHITWFQISDSVLGQRVWDKLVRGSPQPSRLRYLYVDPTHTKASVKENGWEWRPSGLMVIVPFIQCQ